MSNYPGMEHHRTAAEHAEAAGKPGEPPKHLTPDYQDRTEALRMAVQLIRDQGFNDPITMALDTAGYFAEYLANGTINQEPRS